MEFLQEATISGFISKIISDCLDISLIKIKEADKNRKLKAGMNYMILHKYC